MKLRLSRARALMATDEIDALYLTGQHNVRYVSGFKGEPRHLLITQSEIKFGVRIEDCVVVTDDGCENLMTLERDLMTL